MPIENDGLEFAVGANNKQCSIAQCAEGAPLGKADDDREPINWLDSDSGSSRVTTIGELKMRFGDKTYVGSGNLC